MGQGASLEALEKQAVANVLQSSGGSITRAAAALGVARTTLYRKIRKYGLPVPGHS